MPKRIVVRGVCCAVLLTLLIMPSFLILADSSMVSMSARVYPTTAAPGDTVTYTVRVENVGLTELDGGAIEVSLPDGFEYISGHTTVTHNGVSLVGPDPTQYGTKLRWSNLVIPEARQSAVYGMHTFVQDRCDVGYISEQLNWVVEVAGSSAYAKQLVKDIEPGWTGPKQCWVDFVNACYDRNITPVIRLAGTFGNDQWNKPPSSSGDYTAIAEAFARVVAGLPRRGDRLLYIEIWNEPNLNLEWGGAANPEEYAAMAVDVAAAIRAIGDSRIVVMNGGLSPYGDISSLTFIDRMARVDGWLESFDVWAAHTYPGNRPPEYNLHDGTVSSYEELCIDSYLLELEKLARYGRDDLQILLTETGYALGANNLTSQCGYPVVNEANRADYMRRAMLDYWSHWPEVIGVCPFELVDPNGDWYVWDWRQTNGGTHQQYDVLASSPKPVVLAEGEFVLSFDVRVGGQTGTQTVDLALTTADGGGASLVSAAGLKVEPPVDPTSPIPTPTAIPVATVCSAVAQNGGFEYDGAWEIPDTAYDAGYSQEQFHSGSRSMRVGIVNETPVTSYSSTRQFFQMPADAVSAKVSLWYYPIALDPGDGLQYVMLYKRKPDGALEYQETLLWSASNNQEWTYAEFDIVGHAGEELCLYLGARNSDAASGATAMYVDDVSILVCQLEGPTPVPPTPTPLPEGTMSWQLPLIYRYAAGPLPPTPEPTPVTGCTELISNGDCESDAAWTLPHTAYPAVYTMDSYSGEHAIQVGITNSSDNVRSYSSADQKISIPNAADVALTFWARFVSPDGTADFQYILLVAEDGNYDALLWESKDVAEWRPYYFDLTPYVGQTLTLRYGVFNDGEGGVTSLLIDDISLEACDITSAEVRAAGHGNEPLLDDPVQAIIEGAPGVFRLEPEISLASADLADAQVSMLQADEVRQRLVVSKYQGVAGVDLLSGEIIYSRDYGTAVGRVALDETTGRVAVPLVDAGIVELLDRNGHVLTTIEGVGAPVACLITGQGVIISDAEGQRLLLVQAESGKIIREVELGAAPDMMVLDSIIGMLYVAQPEQGRIAVVDMATLEVKSFIELDGSGVPADMMLDAQRNRLYVVNPVSPKFGGLQAIDTLRGQVAASLWGSLVDPLTGVNSVERTLQGETLLLSGATTLYRLDPLTLEITGRQPLVPQGFCRAADIGSSFAQFYVVDAPGRITCVEGSIEGEGQDGCR